MVAKKLLYPPNLAKLLGMLTTSKTHERVRDDAQLKLYSKMLPSEFLHYGYFEHPNVAPERMSFLDLEQAQLKYAEIIIQNITDKERPVLDGGCGMGGLSRELKARGFKPVALTPDSSQVDYIRRKYPEMELTQCRFEEYDVVHNRHRFGTVINSESLQYMDLEQTTQVVKHVMHPTGRWIVTDYFRTGEAHEKSGHHWQKFLEVVKESGFKVVVEQDITAHVLPTMAFGHLLARRLAIPFVEFIFDKIETKTQAIYFILEDVIREIRSKLADQIKVIDPSIFARDKKYMLVVLELNKPHNH